MNIRTARLVLREIVAGDVDAMHAWQTDPRYLEHYPQTETARADTKALVDRFLAWQAAPPRWRWQLGVTLASTGALIGCAGVRRAAVDADTADIGYELDPRHWGRGYATEAVGALLDLAFGDLGLAELTAVAVRANRRSLRVLARLGFEIVEVIPPGPGRGDLPWPERCRARLTRASWEARRA
jgi:RimJ/RimL family protein N-acetyltransferase